MNQQINIPAIGMLGFATLACLFLAACQPTVRVETPDKPVRIDLNVKIEHELHVKIEKDVEQLIKKNPNLF